MGKITAKAIMDTPQEHYQKKRANVSELKDITFSSLGEQFAEHHDIIYLSIYLEMNDDPLTYIVNIAKRSTGKVQ